MKPESRKQALSVTNGNEIQLLVRSKIWVKMSEQYHPDLPLEPKWLWVCVVRGGLSSNWCGNFDVGRCHLSRPAAVTNMVEVTVVTAVPRK